MIEMDYRFGRDTPTSSPSRWDRVARFVIWGSIILAGFALL